MSSRLDYPYHKRVCKLVIDGEICGQSVPCYRHGDEVAKFDELMLADDDRGTKD